MLVWFWQFGSDGDSYESPQQSTGCTPPRVFRTEEEARQHFAEWATSSGDLDIFEVEEMLECGCSGYDWVKFISAEL